MITEKDKKQLESKGISDEYFNWQLQRFKLGAPYSKLLRAASIGDGIIRPDDTNAYISAYKKSDLKITKFVPASGAATRMFKALFEYRDKFRTQTREGVVPELNEELSLFFASLEKFAFYKDLVKYAEKEGGLQELLKNKEYEKILNMVLDNEFLNYGSLPKGMILFHSYDGFCRTAFEEHLVEGALYAKSGDGVVNLHFTASSEHLNEFKKLLDSVISSYEKKYNVKYAVSFSVQKSSTDTMAVTPDNLPFRDENGDIVFRPAGHGALIENLNEIDSDLIFIKNIDNIVPESSIQNTVTYKQVIAGVLVQVQQKVFDFLKRFDDNPSDSLLKEAVSFINMELGIPISADASKEEVCSILDKPIRVVGVIKNTGEPGGGPFWVKNSQGKLSIQIVEAAQVDNNSAEQKEMYESSTHFSPTDIVCGVRNYKGEKYNLKQYVDEETCFISEKSKDGKPLKALELPGLWNGSMAGWISLIVEVPVDTFNPVKIVNDLLRDQHQQ